MLVLACADVDNETTAAESASEAFFVPRGLLSVCIL